MSKLIGSGDFQALGRFAKAIGKSLDTARKETNASFSEDVKKVKKSKREKVDIER